MLPSKSGKRYINEWKRAKDFLQAVENNMKLSDFKTAANREYFAVESAIKSCLAIESEQIPRQHRKIWTCSKLLDLNTDTFSLLRELYDLRLQADYGKMSEIVELTPQTIKIYLKRINELISKIKLKYSLT